MSLDNAQQDMEGLDALATASDADALGSAGNGSSNSGVPSTPSMQVPISTGTSAPPPLAPNGGATSSNTAHTSLNPLLAVANKPALKLSLIHI